MRCLRCNHKATVVRQLPEDLIQECTACGCHALVPAGTFTASEDQAVWTCTCGNTLMELVVSKSGNERLFCIGCGHEKPVTS